MKVGEKKALEVRKWVEVRREHRGSEEVGCRC